MMGRNARVFTPLSVVSLDDLVPADHFYRHLDQVADLSFVPDLVQHTSTSTGRPSIDPIVFFKPLSIRMEAKNPHSPHKR